MVVHVSDQYKELFGTGCNLSEDCNREQVKAEIMGALNVSGRYFTFKEQMKVRTGTHNYSLERIFCSPFGFPSWCRCSHECLCVCGMKHAVVRVVRDVMLQREPLNDPQELRVFVSKLYVYLQDEMHKALNKVTHTHTY